MYYPVNNTSNIKKWRQHLRNEQCLWFPRTQKPWRNRIGKTSRDQNGNHTRKWATAQPTLLIQRRRGACSAVCQLWCKQMPATLSTMRMTGIRGSRQKQQKLKPKKYNHPNSLPSSIKQVKTSNGSQVTSSVPGLGSFHDMSMTEMSDEFQISVVKACVKKCLFHTWKFYQPDFQGKIDETEGDHVWVHNEKNRL